MIQRDFFQRLRTLIRNDQLVLTALAILVGLAAGVGVILFREGITVFQSLFWGVRYERLSLYIARLPWWWMVLAPAMGGLVVGLLVKFFLPGGRPHGLVDAIEATALQGGRMSLTTGLRAAVVNALSIGAGASVGREGPAVHLGAALGGWLGKRLRFTRSMTRTLLGCGVASAVAASFNVPIAGALFAAEVILGHYGLAAFAPVVIASVTGTLVSRAYFGDYPAFHLFEHPIASLWEFPAFVGLGLVSGVVAVLLIRGIGLSNTVAGRIPLPQWVKPGLAGLMVGAIAIAFPQVLGIGYGTVEIALRDVLSWETLAILLAAKLLATCLSLGFGFGGGVFSPALVLGALLGGAYGDIATRIGGVLSSGADAYAILGMGAVAAAVLGAPISTTLIIFEMTGDYALTLGVMLAVVVATVVTRQLAGGSFFDVQLAARGLDIRSGMEAALLRSLRVGDVLSRSSELVTPDVSLPDLRASLQKSKAGEVFVVTEDGRLMGTVTLADLSECAFDTVADSLVKAGDAARLNPPFLTMDDDLATAFKVMRDTGEDYIAVVEDAESQLFAGAVREVDVMDAYNRALIESRREG